MEDNKQISIQELFKELDQVISSMEKDDVSLEESFSLYKNGMDLLKTCNTQIEQIEKSIQIIDEEGEAYEFK